MQTFLDIFRITKQGRIQDFLAGVPTPRREDANLLFGQIFPQLHENDKIWAEREGTPPKFYYADPPLLSPINNFMRKSICLQTEIVRSLYGYCVQS